MSILEISRSTGASLYSQISHYLEEEITQRYQPGDMLPSELILAARFNVNRHTLRRAVDELVSDGIVQRQHGKGVYVLDAAIKYSIGRKTQFTQTLEAQGFHTVSRVLQKNQVIANAEVAQQLQIAEGSDVIYIETLREVEGAPFCLIAHFLPLSVCPEILVNYSSGSLHKYLQQSCGLKLNRCESLASAVSADTDTAQKLKMPYRAPVLKVKSVNLDEKTNLPVEYAVTRFRGDTAELSIKP